MGARVEVEWVGQQGTRAVASLGVSWLGELDGGTRAASSRTYRGRGGDMTSGEASW